MENKVQKKQRWSTEIVDGEKVYTRIITEETINITYSTTPEWKDEICEECHQVTGLSKTCSHGLKRHPGSSLNLQSLSWNAYKALMQLDKQFIGTRNYMGIAYICSSEYKHTTREVSEITRVKIHTALLDAGLDIYGESDKHNEIIHAFAIKDKHYRDCYGIKAADLSSSNG
jgi:hypothetical protein